MTDNAHNEPVVEQDNASRERDRRISFALCMSEILMGAAHDAQNMLACLNNYFLVLEDLSRNERWTLTERSEVKRIVDQMREPLIQLDAVFERVNEYRRLNEFQKDNFQLEKIVVSTLQMLRPKLDRQGIVVKTSYKSTPRIICNKSQIQHMLLNLLLNSLEAMGRGGKLSILTELNDDGDYVRICITDTGVGIPPEFHAEIFQPFFTTKPHQAGSGLGLSIARYIAEEHGGSIEFTSRVGKGTKFSVLLPIAGTKTFST